VSRQNEVVLCTLGTRGDAEPFLQLAAKLAERGHKVFLLSNENWAEHAAGTGAEFVPIAPQDPPQSKRNDYAFFVENTLPSFEKSFRFVQGRQAKNKNTFIVYRSNMLGVESAAERFSLKSARVLLQPSVVRSYRQPPWPMSILTKGITGSIGRTLVVPALYEFGNWTSRYKKHSAAFRESVGLPARRTRRGNSFGEDLVIAMFPEWFAPPQPDWPDNCYVVGFPFREKKEADPELAEFINRQGSPIVFTPGSGVSDTREFFDNAAKTAAALGAPAVFLSGQIEERHRANRRVACSKFADLGWLLPKSRAIVHHGGIGTTAQALRAGIPQVVIPDRFDQPDNALRIASLGLGAAILSSKRPIPDWIGLLRELGASTHVRTQLSSARCLIANENSVLNSTLAIERHMLAGISY